MNTPFEKIKLAREEMQLKQSEMADLIGVSQNNVSKVESGKSKFIPNSYIEFLVGKGYDLNSLFDETRPLQKIDEMQITGVEDSTSVYRLRTDRNEENQVIPLYNLEASAGLVELFRHLDENKPVDYLNIPNLPKCDGAIYVTGDSMYPLLKSGDIVIYKQIHNIEDGIFWGEMYIIAVDVDGDEYISVKYLQKSDKGEQYIKMVSQNSHHQSRDVHIDRVRALAMVKASVRINAMG